MEERLNKVLALAEEVVKLSWNTLLVNLRFLDIALNELVEFYECAGFEDYYERGLKNMDEAAIRKHYEETFAEEDMILEAWEQKNN